MKQHTKFHKGDRVVIVTPQWANGDPANHAIRSSVGLVAIVQDEADCDGDLFIEIEGDGRGGYIAKENVEPEVIEAEVIDDQPRLGTATVNVEVRFFIDGTDVTDRIKTLFA